MTNKPDYYKDAKETSSLEFAKQCGEKIEKITYKQFKEMDETFQYGDIEEINRRAIYYRFYWPSGLGGEGGIRIYTRDHKGYYIEGLPFANVPPRPGKTKAPELFEIFPVLAIDDEQDGWVNLSGFNKRIYIHQDAEEFARWLEEIKYAEGAIEYYLYEETKREREELAAAERHFEEIRLRPEEMAWTSYQDTDQGLYSLLFRYDEKEEEYKACLFMIDFQQEEFKPGSRYANAPIDAYNLFYRHFDKVEGPLQINEYKKPGILREELSSTSLSPTIRPVALNPRNCSFVRSFKTLEKAKEAAAYWAQIWGRINRENLILPGTERKDSVASLQKKLDRVRLVLKIAQHPAVIFEELQKAECPGNAFPHIVKAMGLESCKASEFWEALEERSLFCAPGLEEAARLEQELVRQIEQSG